MGTRALVVIKDGNGAEIVNLQHDSYPNGLGVVLKGMLGGKKLVNGYQYGMSTATNFNGINCMAAYVVKELKVDIGNVYLYPPNTRGSEEFTYTLYPKNGESRLIILSRRPLAVV